VAQLPTGTVTFLFTDIEGSTRLWQEHPEAMRPALARHDELVRAAIESHGGQVVKTTGDGAHAAFTNAIDAVVAAVAAQRAIATEPWVLEEPLAVRIGIHSGPAELRDGDYYGTAVNKAARLMSAAHGGQTLASLATEELARDELGARASLRDLGEHRLRDLSRAERVYQVEADGLLHTFPPLRGLDAFEGNLPVQLTSFVGREEDVATIAVEARSARMVTLTGVGGVGKTRLALQVAAELLPDFPDGAWCFELAPLGGADAALHAMSTALGVPPRPGLSTEQAILDYFATKRALIVLDNCEHLLEPVAELVEVLLHQCPQVHVLATSREGLGVDGEQIRPVRSIRPSDAERLFVERAVAVMPTFASGGPHGDAITEICRRLDGIPLAIELAAARVEAMSPTELAQLLDERFRLLTGGRRTAAKRHQTLRATVDWSYSLLDDVDREVFDRLSVFAGTFDVTAAIAVVADDDLADWDVRDALGRLVRRSMVNADADGVGGTRYSLLETLREYSAERLAARGETEARRRRHAQHYAVVASTLGPELRGADELAARRRIMSDVDNLRIALEWGVSSDDPVDRQLAVTVAAELATEASMNNASGIGRWCLRVEPHAEESPAGYRHTVLGTSAYVTVMLDGDLLRGRALAEAALRDGVPPDSPAAQLAHTALTSSYAFGGELERAVAVMDDALGRLAQCRDAGYFVSIGHSVRVTAVVYVDRAAARDDAEAALRLAREIGNPSATGLAVFVHGMVLQDEDPERALARFDESIALTRAGAIDGTLGGALGFSAALRVRMGDVPAARASLREAMVFGDRVGDRATIGNTMLAVIDLLVQTGDARLAARFAGATVDGAFPSITADAARLEAVIAQIDDALDPQVRHAEWTTGASAPYHEVLATAFDVLEPPDR
jgi:predicted ATPase/class 3 adenylate cyclase